MKGFAILQGDREGKPHHGAEGFNNLPVELQQATKTCLYTSAYIHIKKGQKRELQHAKAQMDGGLTLYAHSRG